MTAQEKQAYINKNGYAEFKQAAEYILQGLEKMGFVDEENFKDTPARVARAYCDIFEGCENTQDQVDEILQTAFPSSSNNMVVETGIRCFSMCPHHLLPVEYLVTVAYIPSEDGKVLGLSKLARLVTLLAKRPMLQEEYAQQIVDQLQKIGVEGAAAIVEGQHMCMRMRGVKSVGGSVTTSSVSGCFRTDPSCKQEFTTLSQNRPRLV